MARTPIPADATEIPFEAFSRAPSPTAASATNRIFGKTRALDYAVLIAGAGMGQLHVVVNAESGDEAAEKALTRFPGAKVGHVAPATDEARSTDDFLGRDGEAA